MKSEALSIINRAEYLAGAKNGRNVHHINSILAQIYLFCDVNRLAEARGLMDSLYRVLHQRNDFREKTSIAQVPRKFPEIKHRVIGISG